MAKPETARNEPRAGQQAAPQTKSAPTPASNGSAPTPSEPFPETLRRTVQGITFDIPTRFKPGHVLTYSEALFASSARNGFITSAFYDTIKKMKEVDKASDAQIQAALLEYEKDYEWSPRGEATPVDPIEAEMRAIARRMVVNQLKKAGKKANLPAEKMNPMIDAVLAGKLSEDIRKRAERNVEEMSMDSSALLAAIADAE